MSLLVAALLLSAAAAEPEADSNAAAESVRVEFTPAGQATRVVEGRVLVEAQDGGLLLQGRDGRLWNVLPKQIVAKQATGQPFKPLSGDEAAELLKAELGEGFEIVRTRHYLIATGAGIRYGQWCGALFERLYDAFHTTWKQKPLRLEEPEFPLMAVILPNETAFAEYAARDVGPQAAAGAKGYYSLASNRMVLYDLTAGKNSTPAKTLDEVQRKIAQNPFNVATVVHEATHQIAFNTGLQTRQADNPLWLSEGMAMYFETPDLTNKSGWKTVGKVNDGRLRQFRDYAQKRRKPGSLASLVSTDERLTNVETAEDAYAEAWLLTHFLIRTRKPAYAAYLAEISQKKPLIWDGPENRRKQFETAFGDLSELERELQRYSERLGK